MCSPQKIVQRIRSSTAREIFLACPEVRKQLWVGEIWRKGFFISTVGQHGNESVIKKYIENQGTEVEHEHLHKEHLNLL